MIGTMMEPTLLNVAILMVYQALMLIQIAVRAVVEQLTILVIPFLVLSLSYKLQLLNSSLTKISCSEQHIHQSIHRWLTLKRLRLTNLCSALVMSADITLLLRHQRWMTLLTLSGPRITMRRLHHNILLILPLLALSQQLFHSLMMILILGLLGKILIQSQVLRQSLHGTTMPVLGQIMLSVQELLLRLLGNLLFISQMSTACLLT